MIYLFNSSYRPLYAANVLNTIFLPFDIANDYRYKCKGDNVNVASDTITMIENSNFEEDVLIIFIDRFAKNGYEFVPLRKAHLKSASVDQDYLFITAKLQDYIFPANLSDFNEVIKRVLGDKGLPRLTDGDPLKTNDGYYVIEGDNIISNLNQYIVGEEAWPKIVDNLSHAEAFSKPDFDPIFLKAKIVTRNKKQSFPNLQKDRFRIVAGKNYFLELSYRYPKQKLDTTSTKCLKIYKSDNINILNNQQIQIESFVNTIKCEFISSGYLKDKYGYLSLQKEEGILIPNANIPFSISEGCLINIKRLIILLVFFLSSIFIGINFKEDQGILSNLLKDWPKLLAALFQVISLFCAFKWFDKKIF